MVSSEFWAQRFIVKMPHQIGTGWGHVVDFVADLGDYQSLGEFEYLDCNSSGSRCSDSDGGTSSRIEFPPRESSSFG